MDKNEGSEMPSSQEKKEWLKETRMSENLRVYASTHLVRALFVAIMVAGWMLYQNKLGEVQALFIH